MACSIFLSLLCLPILLYLRSELDKSNTPMEMVEEDSLRVEDYVVKVMFHPDEVVVERNKSRLCKIPYFDKMLSSSFKENGSTRVEVHLPCSMGETESQRTRIFNVLFGDFRVQSLKLADLFYLIPIADFLEIKYLPQDVESTLEDMIRASPMDDRSIKSLFCILGLDQCHLFFEKLSNDQLLNCWRSVCPLLKEWELLTFYKGWSDYVTQSVLPILPDSQVNERIRWLEESPFAFSPYDHDFWRCSIPSKEKSPEFKMDLSEYTSDERSPKKPKAEKTRLEWDGPWFRLADVPHRDDLPLASREYVLGQLSKSLKPFLSPDFPWQNKSATGGVVIAGGYVANLLASIPPSRELLPSDIDLFVWGIDDKTTESYLIDLCKYLNTGTDYWCICNGNALTLLMPEQTTVQIVLNDFRSKFDVIMDFDHDYVKCMFDGREILATPSCIMALRTGKSNYKTGRTTLHRSFKALCKGFSVNIDQIKAPDWSIEETVSKILDSPENLIRRMKYFQVPHPPYDVERARFLIDRIFDDCDRVIHADLMEALKQTHVRSKEFKGYISAPHTLKLIQKVSKIPDKVVYELNYFISLTTPIGIISFPNKAQISIQMRNDKCKELEETMKAIAIQLDLLLPASDEKTSHRIREYDGSRFINLYRNFDKILCRNLQTMKTEKLDPGMEQPVMGTVCFLVIGWCYDKSSEASKQWNRTLMLRPTKITINPSSSVSRYRQTINQSSSFK